MKAAGLVGNTLARVIAGAAGLVTGGGGSQSPKGGGGGSAGTASLGPLGKAAQLLTSIFGKTGSVMLGTSAAVAGMGVALGATNPAIALLGLAGLGLVAVFGKVAAVLGPLALIGAAIGAQSSGFTVFLGAIRVLGSVLGVLLLPFFVLLSAAVYAAAMMLKDFLMPRLRDYYLWVIKTGTEAVFVIQAASNTIRDVFLNLAESGVSLLGVYGKMMSALGDFIEYVGDVITGSPARAQAKYMAKQQGREVGGGPPDLLTEIRRSFDLELRLVKMRDKRLKEQRAQNPDQPPPKKSFMDHFQDGLMATIAELEYQSGGKAQRTSVVEAAKQAQMAAFMSPFESQMLQITRQSLDTLKQVAAQLREDFRPPVAN